MFDRASSVVCSRSTSLRRDCTWLDRVPAEKRAMKSLQLRDLLLALRVVRLDARPDLRLGQHHVVVAAGVGDDRLVVDVGDVRADVVEEVAVVRDDDQRAVVADEELAQPVDRVEVEVVRRLVEQQRRRMAEQRLRQQHAHLLAALQFGHLALVQRFGDVEALQQHGGVALGRVAVFLADDALQFAEAHAVVVGQVGLAVEDLALLERAPEPLVAHDHGIDHAERVERELVLPQHAELLRPHDGALLRRQFAGQQLHERRFAGAVRPGQPVAPPGENVVVTSSKSTFEPNRIETPCTEIMLGRAFLVERAPEGRRLGIIADAAHQRQTHAENAQKHSRSDFPRATHSRSGFRWRRGGGRGHLREFAGWVAEWGPTFAPDALPDGGAERATGPAVVARLPWSRFARCARRRRS